MEKAILIEAEKFDHNLTLHFGCLADECENEKEYIREATKMVKEFKTYDDDEFDDLFFGEPRDRKDIIIALDRILINISKLKH